jgi:hypothetical protein
MKLCLGLLESSLPDHTRIFGEIDGKLVDLNLAYATYLAQVEGDRASAYALAAFYFSQTIAAVLGRDMVEFLKRGEKALAAARKAIAHAATNGAIGGRSPLPFVIPA